MSRAMFSALGLGLGEGRAGQNKASLANLTYPNFGIVLANATFEYLFDSRKAVLVMVFSRTKSFPNLTSMDWFT